MVAVIALAVKEVPEVMASCFELNTDQSVEERYPEEVELALDIERELPERDKGDEAVVILFKKDVAHSVVLAVVGILYPDVNENTPVPLVYVSPVAVEDNTLRVVEVEKVEASPVKFEPSP